VVVCETLRSGMLQAQSPDWFVGLAASTARTYGATVQHDDRDRGSSGLWSVRPQDVREGWMAAAARLFVQEARADLADAETDSAMSDVAEADADNVYRAAIDRAEGR
jgi:hypothetical protein